MSICLSWYSLASQHTFYQPKKEFLLTERTKNHLRNPPRYAMLHVVGQNREFKQIAKAGADTAAGSKFPQKCDTAHVRRLHPTVARNLTT